MICFKIYFEFIGSGLGAIYFSSIVMVSQYFTSKRGLASGIAFCGSGVGTFIFAPLMEFLITRYTWQGAIWIVSAIILNCVPLGALLRPLYKKETNNADDRNIHQSGNINSDSKISNNTFNCNHITLHILELLKSPLLILYGASCFLCNLGKCIFRSALNNERSIWDLSLSQLKSIC